MQDKLKELLAAEADNSTELNKNAQSEILFGNELVKRYGIDKEAQQDLEDQGLINTNQGVTNKIPMVGDFYFSQKRYYILEPDGSFSKTRVRPNTGKKFDKDNFISDAERFLNNSLDGYEASSFSEITQLDVLRERVNEAIYNSPTSTFSKPRRGLAFTGETSLDQIANRLNLGTSKKFVDEYIKYVNGGEQDKDLTNLMSQDAKNNLRNILNREKKTIDFLLTNSSDKEVRDHVRQSIINAGDRSLDLQNSLGNGNNLDVEYYRQTGKYRFKNTYVFTEEGDLEIRGGGISERIIGIPIRNAPKNYVINKIGGKKNLNKVIQNPMRYTIEIDP